ncbi:MAG: hypothetical protein ACTSYQ_02870 [Candidatus Odinarchaeia archaeon]
MHFYIIYSNRVKSDGAIRLKDIPGSTSRLDVLIRAVLALLNSNYYSEIKSRCILVLENKSMGVKNILFDFKTPPTFLKNEFEAAKFFKRILTHPVPSTINISAGKVIITNQDFINTLENISRHSKIYYLHKNGLKIDKEASIFEENSSFILGDAYGLPKNIEYELAVRGIKKISIGPLEYLTSHCITILQHLILKRRIK